MSTGINGLIKRGFEIVKFKEEIGVGAESKPGTWEQYKSRMPPWIYILSKKKKASQKQSIQDHWWQFGKSILMALSRSGISDF